MRPKPMVEIGGKPILWHIMKIYAAHGIDEFVVCLGYKGYIIKEYFANYYLHTCDVTFDLASGGDGGAPLGGRAVEGDAGGHRRRHDDRRAPEAGAALRRRRGASASPTATASPTSTSGRSIDFHRATRAPRRRSPPCSRRAASARSRSTRAPIGSTGFAREAARRRGVDQRRLLRPQPRGRALHRRATTRSGSRSRCAGLPRDGQLASYRHEGFWQAMDTLRDRQRLRGALGLGRAPWRTWA